MDNEEKKANGSSQNATNSIADADRDFLKEVYIQCNNIYLSFVNFRFQMLAMFVSNAALFSFVYEKRQNIKLDIMVTGIAICTALVIFFVDRRSECIFKRANEKAEQIETFFKVPEEIRIHSKSEEDLKNKISHTRPCFKNDKAKCYFNKIAIAAM